MPASHTNIDVLIANPAAHPLPAGHPAIEPWLGTTDSGTLVPDIDG